MIATRVFWLLLAACAAALGARALVGGLDSGAIDTEQVYGFEETFTVQAAPGPFTLNAFIPHQSARIQLLDERFETGTSALSLEDDPWGRRMQLEGPQPAEPHIVRYAVTVLSRPLHYTLSPDLSWDDLGGGEQQHLRETRLIQVGDPRVHRLLAGLLGLEPWLDRIEAGGEAGDGAAPAVESWRSALQESGVTPLQAITAIFNHCQHRIAPASFSGSTDALTALCLRAASCGGKSRLMAAMCRALGCPTRVVGGVILGDVERKRTSHVWVECLIAGEWVPFDPLNDHFATVPASYLPLYRGDVPLIQHSRGLIFDYGFASRLERIPNVWVREELDEDAAAAGTAPARRRGIPLLRRQQFSLILLAPFALLFTVFCRQVIGLDSMGIFLPVLLGFSITQTGWLVGGGQLLIVVLIGIPLRVLLSRLDLLRVPRNAVMITVLVGLYLLISVLFEALGIGGNRGAMILPLAALAMTTERYTLVAMDRGHRDAILVLLQTFLLAGGCYLILTTMFFRSVTVSFPEIFLVVVAEIIMIGHYRGLRLRELWRFRSIRGTAG